MQGPFRSLSMKVCVILSLFLMSLIGYAQKPTGPAPLASARHDDVFDPKIELGTKLPEDFDWKTHFSKADQSTGSQWAYAVAAHKVLKARLDELHSLYRQKLIKKKDQKTLDAFDKMQQLWEQAAEAEISFVGSEYEGGSEAKVSFATQRFKVYLRRVQELKDLGTSAHFFE